jgi:predicted DNA-binding protein (UPF0251 family)
LEKLKTTIEGKSKIAALKIIQKCLDEIVNTEGEISEKVSWFKHAINSAKPTQPTKDDSETVILVMQEQIEALKLKQQEEINNMLSKLASAKAQIHGSQSVKATADNDSNECEGPKVEVAATSAPLWRREFKIVGQIGKPGQTDKLTFVSLTHQIDSGLKRQYKENEIVDAVIRAISLHSSWGATWKHCMIYPCLSSARFFVCTTGKGPRRNFTNSLQPSLSNQKKLHNSFSFVRSICGTNSVSLARIQSAKFMNDEPLIQKTFMKSFETGLRDDILAANLRPLLRLPELTDEDLMKHVNELACHQAERQNKLACERRARINACDVEES